MHVNAELEDHAHALDDEAELLQQQLLLGRRHPPGPGGRREVRPECGLLDTRSPLCTSKLISAPAAVCHSGLSQVRPSW